MFRDENKLLLKQNVTFCVDLCRGLTIINVGYFINKYSMESGGKMILSLFRKNMMSFCIYTFLFFY